MEILHLNLKEELGEELESSNYLIQNEVKRGAIIINFASI